MQERHLSSTMRLFFWFWLTVMVIVWQTIYPTINDQITAVFKNLSRSWKLRRLITWTKRDRKMCQKLLWPKLLNLSCSLFFFLTLILKVDAQSYSHLTRVLTMLCGASKQTIMLPRELRSRSALEPSETGMGVAAVGWRVLYNPPDDQGEGSWGGWPGLFALSCVCPADCTASPVCVVPLRLPSQALCHASSQSWEPGGCRYRQRLTMCS